MREEIYTLSGNFMLKIAKKSCFSTKKLKKKISIKKKLDHKKKNLNQEQKNFN